MTRYSCIYVIVDHKNVLFKYSQILFCSEELFSLKEFIWLMDGEFDLQSEVWTFKEGIVIQKVTITPPED